jgi:beta-lactamase class A
MQRRNLLTGAGPAMMAGLAAPVATAAAGTPAQAHARYQEARRRFLVLPGEASFAIRIDGDGSSLGDAHRQRAPMFVGSAVKTFILTTYLREVEAGRLSLDEQLPIDDSIRSLVSPVFGNLTGTASARVVLEAMISHSDNTATDVALRRVGVEKVRAFIASTGLLTVAVPASTRRLFSYLAGAREGVDVGWAGMRKIMADQLFGTPRSPVNPAQTMAASAADLVAYYRSALRGSYLTEAASLNEFRRIQAMADLIAAIVPPGIAAHAKGGSIDWQGFHALCAPGQMVVGRRRVTFCFSLSWRGPDSGAPAVATRLKDATSDMLRAIAAGAPI